MAVPATPRLAIPAFHPVPSRRRLDGWSPVRQVMFIGYLAETRSVAEAARRVEMARESAYRLRQRSGAEGFCAAWEAAMGPRLKGRRSVGPRRSETDAADPSQNHRLHALAASKITPEVAQYLTIAELRRRADTGLYCPLMRGGRYGGYYHEVDLRAQHALAGRLAERLPERLPERFEGADRAGKVTVLKNAFVVTPAARYTACNSQLKG